MDVFPERQNTPGAWNMLRENESGNGTEGAERMPVYIRFESMSDTFDQRDAEALASRANLHDPIGDTVHVHCHDARDSGPHLVWNRRGFDVSVDARNGS